MRNDIPILYNLFLCRLLEFSKEGYMKKKDAIKVITRRYNIPTSIMVVTLKEMEKQGLLEIERGKNVMFGSEDHSQASKINKSLKVISNEIAKINKIIQDERNIELIEKTKNTNIEDISELYNNIVYA